MGNLLQIIEDYDKATGGSCGITMVQLCVKAGTGINSLKSLLKELHAAGMIQVRDGINSKLIFPVPGKTNA